MSAPTCDMERGCVRPLEYTDEKGYVYCGPHGIDRRRSGIRCRKVTAHEVERLRSGKRIAYEGAPGLYRSVDRLEECCSDLRTLARDLAAALEQVLYTPRAGMLPVPTGKSVRHANEAIARAREMGVL